MLCQLRANQRLRWVASTDSQSEADPQLTDGLHTARRLTTLGMLRAGDQMTDSTSRYISRTLIANGVG
jgi:hypothetical protein